MNDVTTYLGFITVSLQPGQLRRLSGIVFLGFGARLALAKGNNKK